MLVEDKCWLCHRGLSSFCKGCVVPELLAIPDIRQTNGYSCGEAVLRAVLEFQWEKNVRRPAIACPVSGLHPSTFPTAFRREGLHHVSGAMTTADLRHHASLGRPVIALVQLDGDGHYVVVAGVQRGKVMYQCPIGGPKKQSVEDFTSRWHDTDGDGHEYRQWGISCWW